MLRGAPLSGQSSGPADTPRGLGSASGPQPRQALGRGRQRGVLGAGCRGRPRVGSPSSQHAGRACVPHGLQPHGQAEWSPSAQAPGPQSVSSPPGHWEQGGAWGGGHPGGSGQLWTCWLAAALGAPWRAAVGPAGRSGAGWRGRAHCAAGRGARLPGRAGTRTPTVSSLGSRCRTGGAVGGLQAQGRPVGLWAWGVGGTRPPGGSSTWPWPRRRLPRGVLPWPPSWLQPRAACLPTGLLPAACHFPFWSLPLCPRHVPADLGSWGARSRVELTPLHRPGRRHAQARPALQAQRPPRSRGLSETFRFRLTLTGSGGCRLEVVLPPQPRAPGPSSSQRIPRAGRTAPQRLRSSAVASISLAEHPGHPSAFLGVPPGPSTMSQDRELSPRATSGGEGAEAEHGRGGSVPVWEARPGPLGKGLCLPPHLHPAHRGSLLAGP